MSQTLQKAIELATTAVNEDNAGHLEEAEAFSGTAVVDRISAYRSPNNVQRIFLKKGIDAITRATNGDRAGNLKEALPLYLEAVDYFLYSVDHEIQNERQKEIVREKMEECVQRVEVIIKYLKNGEERVTQDDDSDERTIHEKLLGTIMTEKVDIKWTNIIGLEAVKQVLEEAVLLPIRFPQLFIGNMKPWRSVLLFGPVGTGKTYITQAIAKEANNCTFFSVSAADLTSTGAGGPEKTVKNLFTLARERKPSIIFIDEIDSINWARSYDEKESSRRTKGEFLAQMKGQIDEIWVLGATNKPWLLDPTIIRLFEKRAHTSLPDATIREELIRRNIGQNKNSLTDQDYQLLAEKTEGFSGYDLAVLVKDALMEPIRRIQSATHFKYVSRPSYTDSGKHEDDLLAPCDPNDPQARQMVWLDVPCEKLAEPQHMMEDFLGSLASTKATVTHAELDKLEKFKAEFGQKG